MTARFGLAYATSFRGYVIEPGEPTLRAAYELGRDAVGRGLGVLDLAVVHHDVLSAELRSAADVADGERIVRLAADFFVETLSAFEMVQRGFREAQDAAVLERRQASMLRQLATFLTDASLASSGSESDEELIQLVCEHAIELVQAEYAVGTLLRDGAESRVALARGETENRTEILEWASTTARARGGLREARPAEPALESAEHEALATDVRNRLSAGLTALDGRELGSIQVVNSRSERFTTVDEAVLVHLAQLASGALERARLYRTTA